MDASCAPRYDGSFLPRISNLMQGSFWERIGCCDFGNQANVKGPVRGPFQPPLPLKPPLICPNRLGLTRAEVNVKPSPALPDRTKYHTSQDRRKGRIIILHRLEHFPVPTPRFTVPSSTLRQPSMGDLECGDITLWITGRKGGRRQVRPHVKCMRVRHQYKLMGPRIQIGSPRIFRQP